MKRIAYILASTILVFPVLNAVAANQNQPTQDKKSSAQKPSPADCNKQWTQMQESMAKMYGLMTQIQNTTDPAERQKLLDEHWQLMQQNMQAMRGFGGPMMRGGIEPGGGMGPGMMGRAGPGGEMGPGMMGGTGPGYSMGPGMMGGGPCQSGSAAGINEKQREQFMQRRLDTMQMMMEQMLMRQLYAPTAPGK